MAAKERPKVRAMARSLDEFEAMFAKDFTHPLEDGGEPQSYPVIPTGSIAVDVALKIGGWPEGRISEIWGPEHVGKTTEMMMACREAQIKHPEKMAAWVDVEQTFDFGWANKNGVNTKPRAEGGRFWYFRPTTAQEAADAIDRFVASGMCSVVVIDSVGGMIGKSAFEKDADDAAKVAEVASIITRMVLKASPTAAYNGTALLVVNQVRDVISTTGQNYGPSTKTTGGWALKHITTVKVSVRAGSDEPKYVTVEGQRVPVGQQIVNKIEKNKCAPKGTQATFWLFNQATETHGPVGVDKIGEAWDFGNRYGIIVRAGAYYTFPDGERLHTAAKAEAYLRDRPVLAGEIREKVLELLRGEIHEEKERPDPDELDLSDMVPSTARGSGMTPVLTPEAS